MYMLENFHYHSANVTYKKRCSTMKYIIQRRKLNSYCDKRVNCINCNGDNQYKPNLIFDNSKLFKLGSKTNPIMLFL
jgi:hypothetical protein